MKTPHKHADVIKAWADGNTVQYKALNGKWEDLIPPNPLETMPFFQVQNEYRIKPQDVCIYGHIAGFDRFKDCVVDKPDIDNGDVYETDNVVTSMFSSLDIGSGINNLKLTFDAVTGNLSKAEVI
jgi:hypothetical protein